MSAAAAFLVYVMERYRHSKHLSDAKWRSSSAAMASMSMSSAISLPSTP